MPYDPLFCAALRQLFIVLFCRAFPVMTRNSRRGRHRYQIFFFEGVFCAVSGAELARSCGVFHCLSGSRGALFCRRRPRCWRRHRNYGAWGFTGRRWMPKVGPWKFSENGSADARIAAADGCPPPYRPPRADQDPPSPSVAAPSAPSLAPGPGASITRLHSPQKEENNG